MGTVCPPPENTRIRHLPPESPSLLYGAGHAAERAAALDALDSVDVLIIGGGVTGVGVALDAVTRGLSVALVEAHDLAFGTSRWSSKLVHGGLRYLASGRVGVARESAVERHLLMTRVAPHLIRPLPQVVPLLPSVRHRELIHAGFVAGDVLRRSAGTPPTLLPRTQRIDAAATAALVPGVRTDTLAGAYVAHDGQLVDDARLVVTIARTAAWHGARVLTRVRASDVTGTGATLTDTLADASPAGALSGASGPGPSGPGASGPGASGPGASGPGAARAGASRTVTARAVINATGVWAGTVDASIRLRPSRGAHLVVDATALGNPTGALTVPVPGTIGRFVFAVPVQLGRVIIGLTDEDAPGPIPDEPTPTEAEIDFLLTTIGDGLAQPLTRSDVRGAFAGLRPLIDAGGGATADLSRRHAVTESPSGVITVVGGKLTTYRRMAADAVDAAVRLRGLSAATPCRTRELPLIGAPTHPDCRSHTGLPTSLVHRYGGAATDVVEAATVDRPLEPIAEGIDVTRAEVEFAVTHEGALNVDDVLHRRTRIGLVPADADRARPAITTIVAEAAL